MSMDSLRLLACVEGVTVSHTHTHTHTKDKTHQISVLLLLMIMKPVKGFEKKCLNTVKAPQRLRM